MRTVDYPIFRLNYTCLCYSRLNLKASSNISKILSMQTCVLFRKGMVCLIYYCFMSLSTSNIST